MRAKRAGEGDDLDASGTGLAKGEGRDRSSSSGCVDVIDDGHPLRHPFAHTKRGGEIGLPPLSVEVLLWRNPPPALEEPLPWKLPGASELGGERTGRVVAAPERALSIGRDRGEDIYGRSRDDVDDELSGDSPYSPGASLLPGTDGARDVAPVRDRAPRSREAEPAPGALTAVARSRGAAARAHRLVEQWKRGEAGRADEISVTLAEEAAGGKEQLHELAHLLRLCRGSRPVSARRHATVKSESPKREGLPT